MVKVKTERNYHLEPKKVKELLGLKGEISYISYNGGDGLSESVYVCTVVESEE